MSGDDDIHMYDFVGEQDHGRPKNYAGTYRQGSAYTLPLRRFQETSSEYQEPFCRPNYEQDEKSKTCSKSNEATDTTRFEQTTLEVNGKQCTGSTDELKKIKMCLCVLSLLLAISLLVSAVVIALAALSFNSAVSPAFNSPNQLRQTGSLERNLTELMNNVTKIDNNLNMWRAQLNHNLTLFIAQVQTQLAVVNDRLYSHANGIATLTVNTNGNEQNITLLRAILNTLATNWSITVNSLNEYTNEAEQNITSLRATINALATNWSIVDGHVNSLRGSVSNLQVTASTINGNVVNLQSRLTSLNTAVTTLQANQSKQPVIRIHSISIQVSSTLRITFRRMNSESFQGVGNTSTITTSSSLSATSSDSIIAYRPSYSDVHQSNLGTVFINVDAVYPCIGDYRYISCKLFPNEDDGFRGGRAILEAMDVNSVFGSNTETYSFAFATCGQITSTCIRSSHPMDFLLVCILPSSRCSSTA